MSEDMFPWYLKENLLEARQIFTCVCNPPKKLSTKDKTESLGFQGRTWERTTWGNIARVSCNAIWNEKMLVSTCVNTNYKTWNDDHKMLLDWVWRTWITYQKKGFQLQMNQKLHTINASSTSNWKATTVTAGNFCTSN